MSKKLSFKERLMHWWIRHAYGGIPPSILAKKCSDEFLKEMEKINND